MKVTWAFLFGVLLQFNWCIAAPLEDVSSAENFNSNVENEFPKVEDKLDEAVKKVTPSFDESINQTPFSDSDIETIGTSNPETNEPTEPSNQTSDTDLGTGTIDETDQPIEFSNKTPDTDFDTGAADAPIEEETNEPSEESPLNESDFGTGTTDAPIENTNELSEVPANESIVTDTVTSPTDAPDAETSKPTESLVTTTEGSWIKKGIGKINDIIKEQGEIAKETIGIFGNGMKLGTQISTAAGDLGTNLGEEALKGAMKIGSMNINAGADLTKKGIDIIQKWGDTFLPKPVDQNVHSLADLGKKNIGKLQGLSNSILGTMGSMTDTGLQWINGWFHKGSDMTQNVVDKETDKMQSSIDASTKTIINTMNSAAKG